VSECVCVCVCVCVSACIHLQSSQIYKCLWVFQMSTNVSDSVGFESTHQACYQGVLSSVSEHGSVLKPPICLWCLTAPHTFHLQVFSQYPAVPIPWARELHSRSPGIPPKHTPPYAQPWPPLASTPGGAGCSSLHLILSWGIFALHYLHKRSPP
jgi:hypothetical protein